MSRRPLSDQRHLLVELELDDGIIGGDHARWQVSTPQPHHASTRRHSTQPHATTSVHTTVARPQSASLRRTTTDHKILSPYKLKQRVLSSRSRSTVDDGDDLRPRRGPSSARSHHDPPSMPSPVMLIADAVRQNITQRSRALLDVQDELRHTLPLPSRRSAGNGVPLLSSKAIKAINRLRSLTLSIVEMIRYFNDQLPPTISDPTLWALRHEFTEFLLRLCASDTDCLLSSAAFVHIFESLGVSVLRNPLLDGLSLDSSELLLCSCQSVGGAASRESVTSSSLFQLLVSRLDSFALQMRREYPAWQVLPYDRVAKALLELLSTETRANASRMLPSYLRDQSDGYKHSTRIRGSGHIHQPRGVDEDDHDADDSSETEDQTPLPVAWAEESVPPNRRQSSHQPQPPPTHLQAPTRAVMDPPTVVHEQTPTFGVSTPPTANLPTMTTPTSEPKAAVEDIAPRHAAKKAKRLTERSMTVQLFGSQGGQSSLQFDRRSPLVAEEKKPTTPTDEGHRQATIASALDKLPQFSLSSLGMSNTPTPRRVGVETPNSSSEVPQTPTFSPPTFSPPTRVEEAMTLPTTTDDAEDDCEMDQSGSELSLVLALCRDVQVAAIDLNQRLQVRSPELAPARPFQQLVSPLANSPRYTLSTRYLESELKMLRRFYRSWTVYTEYRRDLVRDFRVACAGRRLVRFGHFILARQATHQRQLELDHRHTNAAKIQRQWLEYCQRQQARRRQLDFVLVHCCFKRCRFFTRVAQRHRQRVDAVHRLQSWWRRQLSERRRVEAEQQREYEAKLRREAAALKLQTLVSHQLVRRKLAKALETNRQFMLQQKLKETKARQEETKRLKLESKRRAEMRVAMESIKRELEAKWREAEEAKERLEQDANQRQQAAELARRQLLEKLARERINRFLERAILRWRLSEAVQMNEAVKEAHRQLEFIRRRLARQQQEEHAKRLLQGRVLSWKLEKSVATERLRAEQRLREEASRNSTQRLEDGRSVAQFVRTAVAESRVAGYCSAASGWVVEGTYQSRLRAKHDELVRLKRQAARERIGGFVLHSVARSARMKAQLEAVEIRRRLEEREMKERLEQEEELRKRQRQRREESERLIAVWIADQVARIKEKQRVEQARREAIMAATRERERLAEEAKAHEQRLIEEQRQQMLEDIQRQLDRERQLRQLLVESMMTTQRLADSLVRELVVTSVANYQLELEKLAVMAQVQRLRVRAIGRSVSRRWRQLVLRRRATTAITKEALWPDGERHVSIVHNVVAAGAVELAEDQRCQLRLYELKCIASARKVQRCWRAWRVRHRKLKRQQAKTTEDALVEKAKGRAQSTQQSLDKSSLRIAKWVAAQIRRRQLTFRVLVGMDDAFILLGFAGGRACVFRRPNNDRQPTRSVWFDRVVTRKLLDGTDLSVHTRSDASHLVHELVLDVHTLLVSEDGRATLLDDGSLGIVGVDELELPRFSLIARQLSKTRSIVKRKQLLVAKVSLSSASSNALSVWDAVASASVDDATFLLQQRVDFSVREPCQQRTPLHMLAFSDAPTAQRVAMLRFLVHRVNADVHTVDASGDTVLMLFAARGCLALVEELLTTVDPELWREKGEKGGTAMHRACAADQPEAAALLQRFVLSRATSVDEQTSLLMELHRMDDSGVAPVHTLSARGYKEGLVQILDSCGSSSLASKLVDQRDQSGRTPLQLAIASGHLELVRLLIQRGADANSVDDWGRSPLHYAIKRPDAVDIISILVENGEVDLQAVDDRGDTALHWAALLGRTAVVTHLLAVGADPTVMNSDWETPAQVASIHRHYDCKRLLAPTIGDIDTAVDAPLLSLPPLLLVSDTDPELPSPKSYYHPIISPAREKKKKKEIDWDELHQDVQLVEESGAFSSEDEQDNASIGWSDDEEEE